MNPFSLRFFIFTSVLICENLWLRLFSLRPSRLSGEFSLFLFLTSVSCPPRPTICVAGGAKAFFLCGFMSSWRKNVAEGYNLSLNISRKTKFNLTMIL